MSFNASGFVLFGINIEWYGLLIGIGMLIGILIAIPRAKKINITSDFIIDCAIVCIPCAIIGARIYYCLFYGESYTFAEFLRIWEGGIAIYGGILGGTLGLFILCLIRKWDFLKFGDCIAPSLVLGQAIGRIGCYFAGCCYGVETTNKNLMFFPMSVKIDGVWHLSTFFYESFFCVIIFLILIFALRKIKIKGLVTCTYFILYGIVRFIIEAFRGDSLYIGLIKVSQLVSVIMVVIFTIVLIFQLKKYFEIKKIENKESN